MESSDLTSGPSEIGSLTAQSNEESQFVGSSSGVFFINTVRRAFSNDLGHGESPARQDFPHPEDTLLGTEDAHHEKRSALSSSAQASSSPRGDHVLCQWEYDPAVTAVLGKAPRLETARELMMVYFQVWHPLFPFLHGPTFLQAMELLYAGCRQDHDHSPPMSHRNACWTTIFQCVFNLACHLRPDIDLSPESKIQSSSGMHALLGTLTSRNDLPSLQALLACQLYLVAKMSLRTASTVGGCMLRSILHAGLHRCPFRYKELSSHDRQLRKRIFWSAYAIDRYLSQALGLPLGIQDSDIDVCGPGAREIHVPGSFRAQVGGIGWSSYFREPEELSRLTPYVQHDLMNLPAENIQESHHIRTPHTTQQDHQNKREITFNSYVESGKLTGRALELFHKSILVRSIHRSSVLFLVTDVHKWWNSLSADLQGTTAPPNPTTPSASSAAQAPFNFAPFFTVLYQHLILLINRPSLSLHPSTPEFCSGLQTCIGAAREILNALKAQVDSGQALFWPGFLSAAWMAGLVLAFACQLEQYVLSKGLGEISKCLHILQLMSAQWETAKHCYRALHLLSEHIQHSQFSSSYTDSNPAPSHLTSTKRSHSHHPRTEQPPARETDQTPIPPPPHKKRKRPPNTESNRRTSSPPSPASINATPLPPNTNQNPNNSPTLPNRHQHSTTPNNEERLFFPDNDTHTNSNYNSGVSDPLNTLTMTDFDELNMNGNTSMNMNMNMNMGDLLEGSSFEDLADMFGMQFPSF